MTVEGVSGAELRRERRMMDRTQVEVGALLGVARFYIGWAESGIVTFEFAARYREALRELGEKVEA